MNSSLQMKSFKSVDEVGKEAIDSLVDDGFFAFGWLKTLEVSKPPINLDPFYIAAYDKSNLVGFTPCFRDVADQYFQYGPNVIPMMKKALKWGNRLHIIQEYVFLCYSPWCFRTKVFVSKEFDEKSVIKDLSKKIDAICKKERILFSSFLFVSEFDKNLILNLEALGYTKFYWQPTVCLSIKWSDFDEYLQSLKPKFRHNVRREIRDFVDNGVVVEETTDFKQLSNTLSDLSLKLSRKYNKWSQRTEPYFYECLSDYAKANTIAFIARKNSVVIGFSLFIRKDDMMDCFMGGFDYSNQEKSDFLYFNLAYYFPIKWAIKEGIKKIYYRWGSEHAKYKRGCQPERIYTFVKCQNRVVNSQIGNYLKIKNRTKNIK